MTRSLRSRVVDHNVNEPEIITEVHFDDMTGEEVTTRTRGGIVVDRRTVAVASGWQNHSNSNQTGWEVEEVQPAPELLTLMNLVGKCVACGDEAELLLCSPCGVGVRELGRQKLVDAMKEMEEDLG